MTPTKTLHHLSIDLVTDVGDQNHHIERLIHGFMRVLVRHRGPLAAAKWKRELDGFMKTHSYEQIITRLEDDFNTYLQLAHNELQTIITP